MTEQRSEECRASIDGWCKTHSTGEGPAYCGGEALVRTALERARFHERENYSRWRTAQNALDAMGVREWEADDGDSRCQRCGRPNVSWFADNTIWNAVMPEGGVLCPTCFVLAADERLLNPVWRLTTESRVMAGLPDARRV